MTLKDFRATGFAIEGLETTAEILTGLVPREIHNLSRAVVHGVAGEVAKLMKQRAPKDEGILRKAIKTKRGRASKTSVYSDVIITHGKSQKYNAWHWHFQEYGTQDHAAQPFVNPTVEEIAPKLPGIFDEQVLKKLDALLKRKAKRK